MPLYEYECPWCERRWEIHHPMSGDPISQYELPEMVDYGVPVGEVGVIALYHQTHSHTTRLQRIISAPAIHTIVRGNHDFSVREKARLKKRSQDHWNKVGRTEAIEKAEAKGVPVPTSGLYKAVKKMRSQST